MSLKLSFDNATDAELADGLAAAEAVLQSAGVDGRTAATAAFDLEGYEISGYYARADARHRAGLKDPPDDQGPSDDLLRLAELWARASDAAHQEVRRLIGSEPKGPGLELA